VAEKIFTCSLCGKTQVCYVDDSNDEEALEEARKHLGSSPEAELLMVCDECWKDILATKAPPPNP
jgi:hypothetical protein